ncbi:MAG TPA: alpha/beta fold hydrolase, partial [Usitatibacter sp.]|nr:alpha/beta fold hydrolase [Usitatibacter sp.]
MSAKVPELLGKVVGDLGECGRAPDPAAPPFETVTPARQGTAERDGVKLWYSVWGESGPWIAFTPIYQIAHSQMLKAVVPYLSRHFRVLIMDSRGNGRSDRPEGQEAYAFEHYYRDFVAVVEAAGADRLAVVGISAAT